MNVDIKTLSLTELKAHVYDQMAVIEQAQQNIRLLNDRIAQLNSEEKQPEK